MRYWGALVKLQYLVESRNLGPKFALSLDLVSAGAAGLHWLKPAHSRIFYAYSCCVREACKTESESQQYPENRGSKLDIGNSVFY